MNPCKPSDTWCTPKHLAECLGPFDLDPCSNPHSHIASSRTYSIEQDMDGLQLDWFGHVFVNPPYSDVTPWIHKARYENEVRKVTVLFLLKLDPSTEWFRILIEAGGWFYPFRSRVTFERPGIRSITPNFPCMLATLGCAIPTYARGKVWGK